LPLALAVTKGLTAADLVDQCGVADTTIVTFGTRSGVSATRSGSRVTVNALATRYDGASDRFIPFGNASSPSSTA
jgi:hypothetical protein